MKIDYRIIAKIIEPYSKVLDLGCGDGELLAYLIKEKGIKAQGIEVSEEAIYKCVEKGVNVFHGDMESGLGWYSDKSFDYVIMNQSMQEMKNVDFVIKEALRVGKKVIVGFPNFAYIKARLDIFFYGKAPLTESLPYTWYNTPNIHFFSIKDFEEYCRSKGIKVLQKYFIGRDHEIKLLPNIFGVSAIFLIEQ